MSASKDKPKETPSALEKRLVELSTSITKSKAEKANVLAEIQKVQPELKKLKSEQRTLEDINKKLKLSTADLEKKVAGNKVALSKQEESLKQTQSDLNSAITKQQNCEAKQAELEKDYARLANAKGELQNEIATLQQKHDHLKDSLRSLEKSISSTQSQASESLALTQAREDQVRISEQRFHAAEKRRKELDRHLEKLSEREEQLEKIGVALIKAKHEHTELILLNAQKEDRRLEVESLQQRCELLQEEKEDISTKITHQRKVLHDFNAESGEREKILISQQDKIQTATALLSEIATKRENLERENQKLEIINTKVTEKEELLAILQEHWEDLDRRYTKLASMPESDPQALIEWREIEKQKEVVIARILPKGGILARPATRITVVPRGNSG